MIKREKMEENFLCLLAGMILAIAFIAMMCGDGDKGLLDLF